MPSFLALGALFGVAILALFPSGALLPAEARLSEKSALLFLLATFLIALYPRFQRLLLDRRDAATFLLFSAFFVLFHLADRAGPREGFALRFASLPDDTFALSYALRLAILGALVSFPAWFKNSGPHRSIWAALSLIGVFGVASFALLGRYYPIGVTETLDPSSLPTLLTQTLGYGSVAALCCAVTSSERATRIALRATPLVLFLVWAKMQFVPLPIVLEDAE